MYTKNKNLNRALADAARVFGRDVCADAFGSNASSNTCNPSSTLCCIRAGLEYPQCQVFLNKGWCCTETDDLATFRSCYVDQKSVCNEANSVSCSRLGSGVTEACCPEHTTCDETQDATLNYVRCRIQSVDLLSLANPTTSTTSSTAQQTPTSGAITSSAASPTTISSLGSSPTPTSSPPASAPSSGLSGGAIAGVAIGPAAAIIAVVGLWFLYRRRQKKRQAVSGTYDQAPTMPYSPQSPPVMVGTPASYYGYKDHHQEHNYELSDHTRRDPMVELPANEPR